jgi:hypothetical protein
MIVHLAIADAEAESGIGAIQARPRRLRIAPLV